MSFFKNKGVFREIIAWQVIGLVIGLMIYLPNPRNFWVPVFISLLMSNSIGLFIHIFEKIGVRSFCLPQRPRRFKTFFWAIVVVIAPALGTVLTIFILSHIFPYSFWFLMKTRFLPAMYFCVFISAIIAALGMTYENLERKIEAKVRENEELKQLQLRTRLMALQSKVNPHFLFNTLNTMLNLIDGSRKTLETMILNLSDIYRKVLQLPENETIPLKDELHLIREYLEIEKIRLGDRLKSEISIDPGLEHVRVPPLLIEPIVENAVIHGIGPKSDGGKVTIAITKQEHDAERENREHENMVQVTVTDTGVGIDEGKPELAEGFGLYSIQERLRLMYKDSARFSINVVPDGGTCVSMVFPYGVRNGD